MGDNFQQLLAKTRKGSLTSLSKLGLSMAEGYYSEPQVDEAIPVLLAHIDEDKLPGSEAMFTHDMFKKSLVTVHCLSGIAFRRAHDASLSRSDMDSVKTLWPRMWTWLSYITKHRVLNKDCAGKLRASTKSAVLFSIQTFAVEPSLQDALLATPDVFQILIQIWMSEIQNNFLHPSESRYDCGDSVPPLVACTRLLKTQPGLRYQNEAIDVIANDAKGVVSATLAHLRRDTRTQDVTRLILDILMLQILSTTSVFLQQMFSQHAIIAVSNVAASLAARTHSSENLPMAIDLCFKYIGFMVEMGDGRTSVIQTIDNHLLNAILQSGRWLTEMNDSAVVLISTILPKYSIYQSVLASVWRALEDIKILNLESQVIPEPLHSKWWEYKKTVESRIRWASALSKLQGNLKFHLKHSCNYRECTEVEYLQPFKRCGNCKTARYCSMAHQRLDWEDEHRICCKENQTRPLGVFYRIPKPDKSFIQVLVQIDVSNYENEINEFRNRHRTKTVGVELNYRSFPPKITVISTTSEPEEITEDWLRSKTKWASVLQTCEESAKEMAAFRAFIPSGVSSTLLLGAIDVPTSGSCRFLQA